MGACVSRDWVHPVSVLCELVDGRIFAVRRRARAQTGVGDARCDDTGKSVDWVGGGGDWLRGSRAAEEAVAVSAAVASDMPWVVASDVWLPWILL